VTQNYTNPIKDGKIEQCVNRTQRQLRATLTGDQTDIYGRIATTAARRGLPSRQYTTVP